MHGYNEFMKTPIYLDYNATTPIDPIVAEAMLPFITSHFGNPSSSHAYGKKAKQAIENARFQVSDLLGCHSREIIFTSCGTESNNLAIKGFAQANMEQGNHIITSAIEHPAVLEVCRELTKTGFELTILPVDRSGMVDCKDLEASINEKTILVSIMHANNEVGTIQPIRDIVKIAHRHNVAVHSDAAQSIGKIEVDIEDLCVDLLSIAGHKLYAPKGIGALYVRDGVSIKKQMQGAKHENNNRPGTENVIGIVGLGKACDLIKKNLADYKSQYSILRNLLEEGILKSGMDVKIHGDIEKRLPNTSSIGFKGRNANDIVTQLTGIAISAGAACHSEEVTISHVLQAMSVAEEYAKGTIRFSTGRMTKKTDINKALRQILESLTDN